MQVRSLDGADRLLGQWAGISCTLSDSI